MKKRKLKRWVRVTLYLIISILLIHFIFVGITKFKRIVNECDKAKGSTCTIYDLRNYQIGE